jgi:quercetin dioxygenase-like cupin family protein
MPALTLDELDFSDAWVEGDPSARWRSAAGHGPSIGARASGSSVLAVPPGCRLPVHTDSAEEIAVVVAGTAEVVTGGERSTVPAGGLALIPADVPHEVRNVGEEELRFVAVYADTDVVSRYEQPIQPSGAHERKPVG